MNSALPLKDGFFHDAWLAYVATNLSTIDFIPKCLVKYRQHDNSETNILNLLREKDNHKMTALQRFKKNEKWLAYCAAFRFNKHPVLVNEIYLAYKDRKNRRGVCLKLALLFLKYRKVLFFIRKKSLLSKLNYIRKETRGIN